MLKYSGFHCGLCGHWTAEPFEIPDCKSLGAWLESLQKVHN